MKSRFGIPLLAALAMVGACSNGSTQSQGNVFKGDTDALKKAQSVEGTLQQGAERERQAIDQASDANSPPPAGTN
ncbi:MAG: hypothetical protein ACYDDO_12950 [Acidiferrobacterales bacterium]